MSEGEQQSIEESSTQKIDRRKTPEYKARRAEKQWIGDGLILLLELPALILQEKE